MGKAGKLFLYDTVASNLHKGKRPLKYTQSIDNLMFYYFLFEAFDKWGVKEKLVGGDDLGVKYEGVFNKVRLKEADDFGLNITVSGVAMNCRKKNLCLMVFRRVILLM